ncbi:MAG: transposase [Azonexus sp.]
MSTVPNPAQTPSQAEPATEKSAKNRRRNQSASNQWHMGRESVDTELKTIYRWTERECIDFLVQVRFGSWETVCCPHCGSVGKHYWRPLQKRWKCAGCGSTFSITSKTVFANRKRALNDLIAETLQWSNTAAGQPALLLKRNVNVTYNTVFTFQQKLREALVRDRRP